MITILTHLTLSYKNLFFSFLNPPRHHARRVYTISDRFNPNYVEKDGSSPPTGSDVTASSNTKFSFWASRAAKKKEKMRNLKRELEMDQHKIPLEELCRRLRTNPTTVLLYNRIAASPTRPRAAQRAANAVSRMRFLLIYTVRASHILRVGS